MSVRIKVCGLTRAEDVDACVAAGVDAVGFNLARGPRRIAAAHAAMLIARLPPFITAVALVMDQAEADIHTALDQAPFQAVQLHGAEPPELAQRLARRLPVIKACTLGGLPAHAGYPCAALLVDAPAPAGIGGGTGMAWDYAAVRVHGGGRPLILAGGLRPETVAAAVRAAQPWAVDVSSGVESAPGCKDPAAITAFVAAARSAA